MCISSARTDTDFSLEGPPSFWTQQQPWKIDSHSFRDGWRPRLQRGERRKLVFPLLLPHSHSFPPLSTKRFGPQIGTHEKDFWGQGKWCPLALRFLFSPFLPSSPFRFCVRRRTEENDDFAGRKRRRKERGNGGGNNKEKCKGVPNKWCATQMNEHSI